MLVYQRVIHSHPFPFQLCKCHHDPQPWTAHRFEIVGQESLIMSHVVRSLFAQLKIFSIIKWIKWHVTSTLLPNPVVLIKGETMWSQSVSKCCCVHRPWHDETSSTELFVDGCHVENGFAWHTVKMETSDFQTHWVFLQLHLLSSTHPTVTNQPVDVGNPRPYLAYVASMHTC